MHGYGATFQVPSETMANQRHIQSASPVRNEAHRISKPLNTQYMYAQLLFIKYTSLRCKEVSLIISQRQKCRVE